MKLFFRSYLRLTECIAKLRVVRTKTKLVSGVRQGYDPLFSTRACPILSLICSSEELSLSQPTASSSFVAESLGKAGLTVVVAAFLLLLSLYLWRAFVDIVVVLKNFNFRRAKRCHWSSCGLFYYVEDDPETGDCLSPYGRFLFEKRSRSGNQRGCRYSIQVREVDQPRKPAADYQRELFDTYSAFQVYNIWWKIITIFVGILVFGFGMSNLFDIIKTFF